MIASPGIWGTIAPEVGLIETTLVSLLLQVPPRVRARQGIAGSDQRMTERNSSAVSNSASDSTTISRVEWMLTRLGSENAEVMERVQVTFIR